MKAKNILTILLLVFVFASIAYMVVKENQAIEPVKINPAQLPTESNNVSPVKQKDQIIVYYFHGDMRCVTCHKLQNYAKEALDAYFANELASGEIVWQETNVDRPENKHFIDDYKLVTKSVILSKVVEGKEIEWINLDQIWDKVSDKNDYLEYIRNGVAKFLEEPKS